MHKLHEIAELFYDNHPEKQIEPEIVIQADAYNSKWLCVYVDGVKVLSKCLGYGEWKFSGETVLISEDILNQAVQAVSAAIVEG